MDIVYTPRLRDYMKKSGKQTVVVELVQVNNSDFEISELHVHFADRRLRELFVQKKGYRVRSAPEGELLLPRFPLELEPVVTFDLKRILFFRILTCKGIKI